MQIEAMFLLIVILVTGVAAICSVLALAHIRSSEKRLDALAVSQNSLAADRAAINAKLDSEMKHIREQINSSMANTDQRLLEMTGQIASIRREMADLQLGITQTLDETKITQAQSFTDMQTRLSGSLKGVQDSVSQQLIAIRDDNNKSLEKMRETVDEKLQKTLDERIAQSFKMVSEQLDSVSKGLGEMRGMAQNVGDLRKVLANVKTRGIVGEVQLGAILEEILSPEQYETNVATIPESANRVEFAVKIPGKDGEFAYLPIDSKFPAETYTHLEDAKESADAASIAAAWKVLESRLKDEAKDIHEKYVAPPATTSFAILFLPFEGLYAEIVSRPGLLEKIQRDWHINVAGPSTMAALLNALQMGFQTVAIQKRADEIQKVLSAVKSELPKYRDELKKAQRQLTTAAKTIDNLVGTRTRAMEKTLKNVTGTNSLAEADSVLGIEEDSEGEVDTSQD
jgi:DNA recombination protein RmuC